LISSLINVLYDNDFPDGSGNSLLLILEKKSIAKQPYIEVE